MEIRIPKYWQIAAGAKGRDYTEVFLQHGLAFLGGSKKEAKLNIVEEGDLLILKDGLTGIRAVGKVVRREGKCGGHGDKEWLRDFDGWDLPAYRFVEWHVPKKTVETDGIVMGTFMRVGPERQHLIALADQILKNEAPRCSVAKDPPPTKDVPDSDILDFLIRNGLRPSAAEELTTAFRRIRLLASYYYKSCKWSDIREHETRSFLILPLLLALGWPEQRMKIELGCRNRCRIDIACFSRPYRRQKGEANNGDCVLILESKGLSQGLDFAHDQAKEYARDFPKCEVVVVSNGYCYKAYLRDASNAFSPKPTAYFNLLRPKDAYPLDPTNVKGCLDLLRLLLPGPRDENAVYDAGY